MPFTVLIVDDEPLAREGLRMLLADDPEIGAVQEAKNGSEAVQVVRAGRPDLVFLDVQMPGMDGFSVVHEIGPEQMPAVVFVTAHDQYAIRAFEINAIDYLLKPVTAERFVQSLARAKARLRISEPHRESRQILSLLETIASPPRFLKRMAVQSAGKTSFIGVEDVDWIRAAENYAELHVAQACHLLHVAMNTLEKSLDPEIFAAPQRRSAAIGPDLSRKNQGADGEPVLTPGKCPAGAGPISARTANAVAASRMKPSGMEPGSRRLFMESATQ
jgi:two-component system LytT family response regulator